MTFSIKRVVIIFLSFILGFVAVVALLFATKQPRGLWEQYYERMALNRANAERTAWEAMMRADTYGGETPEQTFVLFLDALKAEDIDLASKYFEGEKQEEWRSNLSKLQNNSGYDDLIDEIVKAQSSWKASSESLSDQYSKFEYKRIEKESFSLELPDGRGGIIKQEFPAGEYNDEIIFTRNAYANIWKISQL